jgi:hypothetical protein
MKDSVAAHTLSKNFGENWAFFLLMVVAQTLDQTAKG